MYDVVAGCLEGDRFIVAKLRLVGLRVLDKLFIGWTMGVKTNLNSVNEIQALFGVETKI